MPKLCAATATPSSSPLFEDWYGLAARPEPAQSPEQSPDLLPEIACSRGKSVRSPRGVGSFPCSGQPDRRPARRKGYRPPLPDHARRAKMSDAALAKSSGAILTFSARVIHRPPSLH